MNLHTVAPGETLSAIGRIYGVDPGLIARVNGLQPPYPLAVGQSLLVLTPAILHTVIQGDTLWSVALQYGVSPLELLRNNPNLQGLARLYPGEVLVIAWDDVPGRAIDLSGYAYPYVDEAVLRGILPYSAYLAPFTFGVSESGGVVDLNDSAQLRLADRYGVTPIFHLSTLTEDGSFSNERAAYILSDPGRQAALADTVVSLAVGRGYGGIDVDFEFIYPDQAEQYAQFVTTLREKANAVGLEVWVALAPKTSADQAGVLYEGHNYKLLGEAADAVLLMTYEWGYTYQLIGYMFCPIERRPMQSHWPSSQLSADYIFLLQIIAERILYLTLFLQPTHNNSRRNITPICKCNNARFCKITFCNKFHILIHRNQDISCVYICFNLLIIWGQLRIRKMTQNNVTKFVK